MKTFIAPAACALALAACTNVPVEPTDIDVACPASVPTGDLPEKLSGTGLFDDACVRNFAPQFALWTDGAVKDRFVYLPSNAVIDDSDVDAWQVPVGTRLWKEFTRDGVKVETRVLWKTAADEMKHGAYKWDDGDADATLVPEGEENARGTAEDIPGQNRCTECHGDGGAMRPLGFSAIQLAHADDGGVTTASLLADGRLSHTPSDIHVPGTPKEKAAIGWMHANCGACHRDGGYMQFDSLRLALTVGSLDSVANTPVVKTAVGHVAPEFAPSLFIKPGDAENSVIFQRASARDGEGGMQMPPIGTEVVDQSGGDALREWIQSL